jgi:hypothetical protein
MASMWIFKITNISGEDKNIVDLGITIEDSTSEIVLSEFYTYTELANSDDLREFVGNGDFIVNNGYGTLTPQEGVDFLTLENIEHLEDNYYSIDELQTPGSSVIDWTNIANAPSIDQNTLDEAYDHGGPGAGRVINADNGPVKIDRGSSTSASIEIVPKSLLPSTGLSGGQIDNKNGVLCIYDGSRSKWLSVSRPTLAFGRSRKSKNQYLNFWVSETNSNMSGIRMPRNATIVSLSGQFETSGTGTFEIRKNDAIDVVASLDITSDVGNSNINIDTDVSEGDFLQCYISSYDGVDTPIIFIELAWRP